MNSQLKQQLSSLPQEPGIYKYYDSNGELLYVGKAVNLKNRVKSYFVDNHQSAKTRILVRHIASLEYIIVRSEIDALILEANLIKEFKPRYNIILKDDKSHLYVKITLYEDFPRISTCRQTDMSLDPKAEYFGPYPSSSTVKKTLRTLRRVFPYLAHNQPPVEGRRRPPQSYFYYNLTLESTTEPIDKQEYRKQVFQLVRFLEGKRQSVTKELEKEMNQAAKSLAFERAANLKQQIDGMNYLSQLSISPESYVSNPELIAEKREQGIRDLINALAPHYPDMHQFDESSSFRIECYDISNISGLYAVGSMVVFINGEPSKSDYRRFRIKRENSPNDVAMMTEVLRRRFTRLKKTSTEMSKSGLDSSFNTLPNLVLVDGGKGQLSAVKTVLNELDLAMIPLAGMTKREEELVVLAPEGSSAIGDTPSNPSYKFTPPEKALSKPKRSSAHGAVAKNINDTEVQTYAEQNFTTIRLARGTEALFLIQRIRDEAHRFAITYHRKVRAKNFLPNK